MALQANSYGDIDEIAALTPRFANGFGKFDNTTRPTEAQVESLTDQVSGVVNTVLSQLGFGIPVSQADAKLMLDLFVNQEVAAIVEGINNAGRFGPTAKTPGGGRFAMILTDVKDFLKEVVFGLEELGLTRSEPITIGYMDQDASGDDVFPLFQVEAFGNTPRDWDS